MMTAIHDVFGSVVSLQFAIQELCQEVGVDTCKEYPRLMCMALKGLEQQADELVERMKKAMLEDEGEVLDVLQTDDN